jgi:hypothetical protein
MTPLAILSLHLRAAPLGRAAAVETPYLHLDCAAGERSMPPPTSQRAALGFGGGADIRPRAGARRASDLAHEMTGELAASMTQPMVERVGRILHCQATLDEEILSSACLRIGFSHFPRQSAAVTLGQAGTSAFIGALQLAASLGADEGQLFVVSAADKWLPPFDTGLAPLVQYGDAAAAACIGHAHPGRPALAVIEAIATGWQREPAALWERSPEATREAMAAMVAGLIRTLMRQQGVAAGSLAGVIGEAYGSALSTRVLEAAGLPLALVEQTPPEHHLSSADFVHCLLRGVRAAAISGSQGRYLMWSASPCGAAGAALVRCHPHAVAVRGAGAADLSASIF